jgi:hypothetical protein
MKLLYSLIAVCVLLISTSTFAENSILEPKFTISGNITDALNGEQLIGATVFVKETSAGTTTNVYGFYSLSLPAGKYTLLYSFIGYKTQEQSIELKKNLTFNMSLATKTEQLNAVEITGERKGESVRKPEMSVVKMDVKTISRIPALMGEVDIIRALQLLPGVKTTSEGSTGFSVRGGAQDQNLILLDEAPVYNASHLLGFFSIFNNDALKDVKIYKGDIPAANGGRLSSLLDIRMKDGNNKSFSGKGGIGTISSRLTLEGPLVNENTSFIVSGRRTYVDMFLPLSSDKNVRENTLYFYDFNAKISHRFNDKNRLFISGYMGRDVFENKFAYMDFGNQTLTARWNHLFSSKLFSNFTFIYSKYDYALGSPEEQANAFIWKSKMKDFNFKADFNLFANPNNTVKFGIQSTYHTFNPGSVKSTGADATFNQLIMPLQYSLESAVYVSNEQKIGELLSLKYGLRLSMFNNIGEATNFIYNNLYQPIDSTVHDDGEFYNTYINIEPRLAANYQLNEVSSLKASYSRTAQYIQLAQNSTAGTPLDIWFACSPNVKPQLADQLAIGYARNLRNNTLEASVEAYYKNMQNAIDFKDQADLLFNEFLEGEIRRGKAWAYGIEFLLRKTEGKLTGWIGYTYSVARRQVDGINNGNAYNAPYDKPNDVSIVLNYELNKRHMFSMNWVYSTGNPVTFPTGRAQIGNNIIPIYSDRNAYRMPDYHRLDVSYVLKPKERPNRKWDWELNFSIYNAYGRKNAWTINFVQDKQNPELTYAEKTYLFSIIPAVTFNFEF